MTILMLLLSATMAFDLFYPLFLLRLVLPCCLIDAVDDVFCTVCALVSLGGCRGRVFACDDRDSSVDRNNVDIFHLNCCRILLLANSNLNNFTKICPFLFYSTKFYNKILVLILHLNGFSRL